MSVLWAYTGYDTFSVASCRGMSTLLRNSHSFLCIFTVAAGISIFYANKQLVFASKEEQSGPVVHFTKALRLRGLVSRLTNSIVVFKRFNF
jgi:hypothetical protein